ncbi:MAG: cell division protein ZapA [Enterocloster clostridioformis]
MEKETYSLKHELVSTQMKLEAVLKDLEERQRELDRLNRRTAQLEGELKEARENLQNLRTNSSAETESKARVQVEAVEEIEETVEVRPALHGVPPVRNLFPVPLSGKLLSLRPLHRHWMRTHLRSSPLHRQTSLRRSGQHSSLRALTPRQKQAGEWQQFPLRAAATAAPSAAPSAAPRYGPSHRGMTDEELARKALQAARKAGSHKGGRR